jgi:hypothetical protein
VVLLLGDGYGDVFGFLAHDAASPLLPSCAEWG